jgi:hypothetical protein
MSPSLIHLVYAASCHSTRSGARRTAQHIATPGQIRVAR